MNHLLAADTRHTINKNTLKTSNLVWALTQLGFITKVEHCPAAYSRTQDWSSTVLFTGRRGFRGSITMTSGQINLFKINFVEGEWAPGWRFAGTKAVEAVDTFVGVSGQVTLTDLVDMFGPSFKYHVSEIDMGHRR